MVTTFSCNQVVVVFFTVQVNSLPTKLLWAHRSRETPALPCLQAYTVEPASKLTSGQQVCKMAFSCILSDFYQCKSYYRYTAPRWVECRNHITRSQLIIVQIISIFYLFFATLWSWIWANFVLKYARSLLRTNLLIAAETAIWQPCKWNANCRTVEGKSQHCKQSLSQTQHTKYSVREPAQKSLYIYTRQVMCSCCGVNHKLGPSYLPSVHVCVYAILQINLYVHY